MTIAFVGRIGVLDPAGAERADVERLLKRRSIQASTALVDLLAIGAGGSLPYTFEDGPGAGRDFGHIATLAEMAKKRSALRPKLVVFAIGGGGDLLLVAPDGQIFGEIADRSGSAARTLHVLASSVDALLRKLVPAEDLLDDMIEFAEADGQPNRPVEIAELKLHWASSIN